MIRTAIGEGIVSNSVRNLAFSGLEEFRFPNQRQRDRDADHLPDKDTGMRHPEAEPLCASGVLPARHDVGRMSLTATVLFLHAELGQLQWVADLVGPCLPCAQTQQQHLARGGGGAAPPRCIFKDGGGVHAQLHAWPSSPHPACCPSPTQHATRREAGRGACPVWEEPERGQHSDRRQRAGPERRGVLTRSGRMSEEQPVQRPQVGERGQRACGASRSAVIAYAPMPAPPSRPAAPPWAGAGGAWHQRGRAVQHGGLIAARACCMPPHACRPMRAAVVVALLHLPCCTCTRARTPRVLPCRTATRRARRPSVWRCARLSTRRSRAGCTSAAGARCWPVPDSSRVSARRHGGTAH
jgi:hypothetical protein